MGNCFIGAPDQLHQTMQSKFKLKVRFSKVPRLNEQFEIVSQEQEYISLRLQI